MHEPSGPGRSPGATPEAGAAPDAAHAAATPTSAAPDGAQATPDDPRLARWEDRLFWPVLLAALAAIPAMFLTMAEGTAAVLGEALNTLTMLVFAAETAVLWGLARDKRRWLREHWFVVTITALTIPAVLLALGPVQVLRLVRFVGALRIIRVGRILKAGRVLYERSGAQGPMRAAIAFGATVLAATFVALVLADPTAESRQVLEDVADRGGLPLLAAGAAVVLAAGLIGGATFVLASRSDDEADPPDDRTP